MLHSGTLHAAHSTNSTIILLLQFVLAWLCSLFSVQLLAVQLRNFLTPGTAHCSPHDDVNQANVL